MIKRVGDNRQSTKRVPRISRIFTLKIASVWPGHKMILGRRGTVKLVFVEEGVGIPTAYYHNLY